MAAERTESAAGGSVVVAAPVAPVVATSRKNGGGGGKLAAWIEYAGALEAMLGYYRSGRVGDPATLGRALDRCRARCRK